MDDDLNRLAGLEKCRRILDLSTADFYQLALAKRLGGTILTTDEELAKTKEAETHFFSVEESRLRARPLTYRLPATLSVE